MRIVLDPPLSSPPTRFKIRCFKILIHFIFVWKKKTIICEYPRKKVNFLHLLPPKNCVYLCFFPLHFLKFSLASNFIFFPNFFPPHDSIPFLPTEYASIKFESLFNCFPLFSSSSLAEKSRPNDNYPWSELSFSHQSFQLIIAFSLPPINLGSLIFYLSQEIIYFCFFFLPPTSSTPYLFFFQVPPPFFPCSPAPIQFLLLPNPTPRKVSLRFAFSLFSLFPSLSKNPSHSFFVHFSIMAAFFFF